MNFGSAPSEEILNHISYDPATGEFRRLLHASRAKAGDRADKRHSGGYMKVWVLGRVYQAHRLAWFFHYGEWPASIVDHENLDKCDNRIENLRLASPSGNAANSVARGRLLKGVTFHPLTQKYQAQIKKHGKNRYLGLFVSEVEAHAAYMAAAAELHGEFARAA